MYQGLVDAGGGGNATYNYVYGDCNDDGLLNLQSHSGWNTSPGIDNEYIYFNGAHINVVYKPTITFKKDGWLRKSRNSSWERVQAGYSYNLGEIYKAASIGCCAIID